MTVDALNAPVEDCPDVAEKIEHGVHHWRRDMDRAKFEFVEAHDELRRCDGFSEGKTL